MKGDSSKTGKPEHFEPARLSDMIALGISITAHCRKCGHWARLDPAALGLPASVAIPALENRFLCGLCGSRDTTAMPEYRRPPPS